MFARKVIQPILTIGLLLMALSVVAATLRRRPQIQQPENITSSYQADGFHETLVTLNRQLAETAQTSGVETAPRADNLTVARRLSLALVGCGLSLEEVRGFTNVDESEQIQWLTARLLQDQRWVDYFAERFARAFVGTDDGPFLLFRRGRFNAWLSNQLASETPYDQIVRQMLSAEGLWTDTPQVNFITATMDAATSNRGDPIRLAGRVSRAFLAQRIDCLQCHDDFLGSLAFGQPHDQVSGTQEHFHELAAFFSGACLDDVVFRGIRDDGRDYELEFLSETESRVVEPSVPFSKELLPAEGDLRDRLAAWVTHNENVAFSRATVNRVWALLFSRPLVGPVDSIPLYDEVPPMLDTLAKDFAAHNFNIKRLIRLLAECDAMRRGSRAEFDITPEHEDAWAAFPITQLRPEQVAASIRQACKLRTFSSQSALITRLRSLGESQNFLKRFGDRGEDEFDSDAVTIAQRLEMMNGNLTSAGTKVDLVANASTRIATLVGDDHDAVRAAYYGVLNRPPSESELTRFTSYLAEKSGNARAQAVGDIYWAMINSTEFSWNH